MALIPPQFLNSVLSIEVEGKGAKGEPQLTSIATGFLVGKATGEANEIGPLFKLFVITNRHVFEDLNTNTLLKTVYFRFNTVDGKAHYFRVDLVQPDGTPIWARHQNVNVDLAVLPISANAINEAQINYHFFTDVDLFYAKDFEAKNVSTGDGLFVLGFPMSISGKSRNFVIVRQGIIARVDEEVLEDGFYYIDASAFPGNSGGPVIVKPELVSLQGSKPNQRSALIGVISSGVTFNDVAISQQTGEPRIIFKEQTGLIRVVPVELIFEVIDGIMAPATPEAPVEAAEPEVSQPETDAGH